jgi:hypothetical protein
MPAMRDRQYPASSRPTGETKAATAKGDAKPDKAIAEAKPAAAKTASPPARPIPHTDLMPLPPGETLAQVMARLRDGKYADDAAVDVLNTLSLRAALAGKTFSPVFGGRGRAPAIAQKATQSAAAETAAFEP